MAKIHVPFFEGLTPKKSPHLLKDTEAFESNEARLDRGHLEGWKELGVADNTFRPSVTTRSLYPYKAGWLFWDSAGVDVTTSPVLNDAEDRLYYSGDGYPKITYHGRVELANNDARGLRLGIPAPKSSARVEYHSDPTGAAGTDPWVRHYAYSFVTSEGKETALSRPTTSISVLTGDDVPVQFPPQSMVNGSGTTEWSLDPTTVRRLYRVGSDTSYTVLPSDVTQVTYSGTVVDSRTVKLTFNHGVTRTIEHLINATDTASFTYNSADYTATVGSDSAESALSRYLAEAENSVDPDIKFGIGLLDVTIVRATDNTSTTVTIKAKSSSATLTNVVYTANSHYHHVADVVIGTNTYNDILGSTIVDTDISLGVYVNPGATGSSTTLWTAGSVIPKPSVAPTSGGGSGFVLQNFEEDRAYVYTFANLMGEEGPPSPPSDVVTVVNGAPVTLNFSDDVDSAYNLNGGVFTEDREVVALTSQAPTIGEATVIVDETSEDITIEIQDGLGLFESIAAVKPFDTNAAIRNVYRTATGTTGTEFQRVAAVSISDLEFVDNIQSDMLGEVLVSGGWYPPPEDLQGLVLLPNGFLAGFSGRKLCFSEAYVPHAWPEAYQIILSESIVGIGVSGNSVAVMTKGFPYLITGDNPSAMSALRIESAQSCASKASIVDMGDFIVYASPDGLVRIGEGGADVLTNDIFTRSQWQEYGPSDLVGFLYEGYYVGSSQAKGKSFIMSKEGVLSDIAGVIVAHYQDYENDRAYVINDDAELRLFNEGDDNRKVVWKSKPFRFNSPTSLGALKLMGTGLCAIRLWGDGGLLSINPGGATPTELIISGNGSVVRLPGGTEYLEYQFELSTYGVVDSITLVSSVGELFSD